MVMMSLEGLVSEIGCGVLSEGKAEGVDSTEGARVWHARLRIGGACGHGGGLLFGLRFTTAAKKNLPTQKLLPNIQHEQANRHALGGRAAPHVSVGPRVFGRA